MTTSPYKLADDVFMCLADKRIVFLDLRRNQYLCLNRHNTQTAIGLFAGSIGPDRKSLKEERAANSEEIRLVVQALTERELLTEHGINGKEPACVRIQTPETVLFSVGSRPKPTVGLGYWAVFLHASLKASWKLRFYSMQRTVRSVENRKQLRGKSQTADALRELVAIFHHLRPLYPRKYLCLFDSLALVEFLAHYRLFPRWVYGVTAEPFIAHCWVQEDNCVLNDAVEYVRGFTPIMVI